MPDREQAAARMSLDVREVRGAASDPMARAAVELLDAGLSRLAHGHAPGAAEGPGALVSRETWLAAVRTLADRLLAPAAVDGVVTVPVLPERARAVLQLLYPEPPADRRRAPAAEPQPWAGRLVVVLGCGRSGTTWLERMLMSSPLAGGVDGAESFLFEQCSPLWATLPRLAPLVDRDRLVPALRQFCDTVFRDALAAHSPGATHFVEKTPLHSLMVPQLRAVYPDAAYLHLVRDGRDVARSISAVPFFGIPDPADAARLWRRVLEAVRAEAPQLGQFREVRYEQLLADPVREVGELLQWLGLPVTEEVAERLAERSRTRVSAHAGTAQAVGTGTWQALPRGVLAQVYAECGALLVQEGYAEPGDLRRGRRHPAYWQRRLARASWTRATVRPPAVR